MTPEQKQRLETLRDDLLEIAMVDADPRRWVGAGKAPVDMTQKERGDAYWCRKMVAATVSLLITTQANLAHQLRSLFGIQVIDIRPAFGVHRCARRISRGKGLDWQQLGRREGVKVGRCFRNAGKSRFSSVGE